MRQPARRTAADRSGKAERDQLRERMLAYGCSHAQVAAELARRLGARPRLAWRYALGWPQWKLAMEYNAVTGRTGMSDARISEYEAWPFGGVRPTVQVLAGLAAAFGHGCTASRLVDAEDLDRMDRADRLLLAGEPGAADRVAGRGQPPGRRGQPGDRCDQPAGSSSSEADAAPVVVVVGGPDEELRARGRRRDALVHPVGPGDGPTSGREFAMAAAEQSAEFAAWAEATNVGRLTLDQLHTEIRAVARSHHVGPLPLFQRTVLLRNRAFGLLEGRQRPDQTRDLYLAAGWSCALLTWFSMDLGHYDAAETQGRTAWLCAELADHRGLRAWTRAAQGSVAYWRGDLVPAARLAEDGLQYVDGGTAGVMLASMAATNWAQVGRVDEATTALRRAREERNRDQPDEIGGILTCTPARQHGFAGSAQLWLGDHPGAVDELTAALDHFSNDPDGRQYGSEMIVRTDSARAQLHLGRLDDADDVLRPVFALPVGKRHAPMVQRLGGVFDLLGRPRYRDSTQARALQERIADFRADSLPRILPG